ncbi:hypothetical protein RsS62_65420 [Rhizobium dioscoreae]|uniref:Uncharacterized protein n=1 Tax=Rhizobium dioscoreae TaxID=2653122 RepID=A0ABQ0ZC41_9HYPH|nr:hypothetical protein RsS62_65420 [Rhizobium dioscoreae]GES52839.1 hypothetical protein RsS93_54530 [Rhizobium dioscoreae]GLU84377.1 hypothetical protein Rhsp01_55530 [Rhizobium sp. NBRC 114257]
MNDLLVLFVRKLAGWESPDHGAGIVDKHVDAVETLAGSADEIARAIAGGEIAGNEKGAALGFRFHQKIRQIATAIAANMNKDMGSAIEKLARDLQPDATAGAGDHDVAIFE